MGLASIRSSDTSVPSNAPAAQRLYCRGRLSNREKQRFRWKRTAPFQAVRSGSIPKFRALVASTHESVFRATYVVHDNSWGSLQSSTLKRNIQSRPPGLIRTAERSPLSARQSTEPLTWPLHFLWKVRPHLLRRNAKIVLPNVN
jgi:hypothetical protein